MDEKAVLRLIENYMAGKASGAETRQLDAWLNLLNLNPALLSSLSPAELQHIAASMFSVITHALDAHPDVVMPCPN